MKTKMAKNDFGEKLYLLLSLGADQWHRNRIDNANHNIFRHSQQVYERTTEKFSKNFSSLLTTSSMFRHFIQLFNKRNSKQRKRLNSVRNELDESNAMEMNWMLRLTCEIGNAQQKNEGTKRGKRQQWIAHQNRVFGN